MTTSPRSVAVLSRSFSKHPVLRAELQAKYPQALFNDTGRTLAGEELIAFLRGHDAAVVALEKIDDATLAALPDLRIISKYGVGLDNVDLAAAARRGIRVGWEGGVNRRSVAELAIGFMIAGLRGVITSHEEIKAGTWRQYRGRQLGAVTVGLLGFGHVGRDVAGLLRAFGTRVLTHDIRDVSAPAAELGVEVTDLDTLVAQSDVISLHIPNTTATRNIFGADRLAAMKPGAVLVNTARGGLVDEDALKASLASGHLSAACFDVFAFEPPQDMELFNTTGFIGTGHIGGSAEEAVVAMGRAAIAGLDKATDPLSFIPSWAA
ncbi:phosphoglycerate dehydrogenase [Roseomonas marmotae]|uniref:Phosphoglycerate dehydrogenase n=1 Tax=Roseomonas marmotae TaxID=2768161 RepID=A0ABS3KEC7_9PROT|nr:phosphoglycerate dehydrogenase [Roseomonas marmotae]MBO1075795.1 phosphoglycerate dehydrogenase [Roseomonas marmotae]QTI80519.1 phosphoglycerate dehydrogenase [Roseomonas marmotae]